MHHTGDGGLNLMRYGGQHLMLPLNKQGTSKNIYLECKMFILLVLLGMVCWSVVGAWDFMEMKRHPKTFKEFVKVGPIYWIIESIKLIKRL